MSSRPPTVLPYDFHVPGSPVSVNKYGKPDYKVWRGAVYAQSVVSAGWTGALVSSASSVYIRYYRYTDTQKDVDNILKAILDALDGKGAIPPGGGAATKHALRVLDDDRKVEQVACRRTNLDFSTRLNARHLKPEEYNAALQALGGHGAAVYISVRNAPNHAGSVR